MMPLGTTCHDDARRPDTRGTARSSSRSSRKRRGRVRSALRIPAWCREAKLAVNGAAVENARRAEGLRRDEPRRGKPGDEVELRLPMPIQRIEAHPRVTADAGRVAIQRGPIVYCFEAVDNDGASQHRPGRDPKFSEVSHKPICWAAIT